MPDNLLNVLYLVALLAIYLGEKLQQYSVIRILRDALERAQNVAAPPASPDPKLTPAPEQKPEPKPSPAPSGQFADYPKWFQGAVREIGNREEGNNRGAAVQRYI